MLTNSKHSNHFNPIQIKFERNQRNPNQFKTGEVRWFGKEWQHKGVKVHDRCCLISEFDKE